MNMIAAVFLRLVCLALAGCVFFDIDIASAATVDVSATNKYALSENSGWINFKPTHGGVTVHPDHLTGYAWSESIGWIKLGADIGGPYNNTTPTNWGVNMDPSGNLSGYAWSENAGWINFNPTHSQVTIDQISGDFDGYAWSESVGFIHLQNTSPAYKVQAPYPAPTTTTTTTAAPTTTTTTAPPTTTTTTAPPITRVELPLNTSWNLVSSLFGVNTDGAFGDSTTYASIWKWIGTSWAVYLPADADGGAAYAASKGFELLSTIQPGEGFWVNVNSAEPPTVSMSGELMADTSLAIAKDWNLLGLKSDQPLFIANLNDGEKSVIISIWKWTNGTWEVCLPADTIDGGQAYANSKGFNLLDRIYPGEGFWVNAKENMILP